MTNESSAAAAAPGPRRRTAAQRAFAFLTSPTLAIALLVGILACCLVGVTVVREERAWKLIFSTLWFNGALVLLAVSSATAFITRIWRRKLTLVSAGMILFHVSFAALLGGVVYNALFHFRGVLRLTEGETLPNGALESYDRAEAGQLFDFSRLRGETTLIRMHPNYTVDGLNKRAAYEIEVGEGDRKVRDIIYVNRGLDVDGVRYLCSKEGFSVLVVLSGKDGQERYGAYVPLQSLKQPDGSMLHATGTATGPGSFDFPPPPEQPLVDLLVAYRPSTVAFREGDVQLTVAPIGGGPEKTGKFPVGGALEAGELKVSAPEVRFWVGMDVKYQPGLPFILGSMCTGLLGIVITFAARVRQGAAKARRDGAQSERPGPAAVQLDTREETT